MNILAWHFLPENGKTRYNNLPVEPGITRRHDGPLELCASGLHASVKLEDALSFAPGPILCRVVCSGETIHGTDKLVSHERTILYMFDASRVLRLWGCWCVRNTKLRDGRTVWDLLTDPRSRNSVEVAERYAIGEATKKELAAARDAARAAARAGARTGAWAAARDAARAAAWDAARAAAWAAARAGARDATWDAASKQLLVMAEDEAKRLGVWVPDPEVENA